MNADIDDFKKRTLCGMLDAEKDQHIHLNAEGHIYRTIPVAFHGKGRNAAPDYQIIRQ